MRVLVNVRDGSIVVDGEARWTTMPPTDDDRLHVSWDGEVGIIAYAHRDSEYFYDETEIGPYLQAWEDAPPREPPPLPPWEDPTAEVIPAEASIMAAEWDPASETPIPRDAPPPEAPKEEEEKRRE